MTPAAFTRRGAALLAAAAGLSLLATFGLGAFGDLLSEPATAGADSWSRSALGHRALLELARSQGRTVLVSRHHTAARAAEGAITAVLEPAVGGEDGGRSRAVLEDIHDAADRLLVVLPKRVGHVDPIRPQWIGAVDWAPIEAGDRVLEALGLEAKVVRPAGGVAAFRGELPAPELADPQLVRSEALRPLLASDQGILVGELESEDEGHLILVADPDLVETHGLGRGRNAELVTAILDRFGDAPALVIDETLHGHELQPSITRELLRFPLVLATIQALIALGLLAWAALVRFGRPLAPAPLLRPGKVFLVEHTAELLRAGGYAGQAARDYLRAAREEVLARVPPPGTAEPPGAWLARLEATRGRAGRLRALEARVAAIEDGGRGAAVEAVRAAREISRWREELTDGAAGDPGARRGDPR